MAWYCKKCNHEIMKIIFEEGIGMFPIKNLSKQYKFINDKYRDIYTCDNKDCKVVASHEITEIADWVENGINNKI